MSDLFDRVVAEPAFRANLPRPDAGEAALAERLTVMAGKIQAIFAAPETARRVGATQRGFRYPRHGYDLPDLLREPADDRYRVRAKGIRLVAQGGRFGLVQEGSRAATEVPAEAAPMVRWVLERPGFSRAELAGAFPERGAAQLDRLLRDLGAMRLTEPA
jgi:hypothetical protein